MSLQECASDVYKNGGTIGVFDMTKDAAERYCQEQSVDGWKYDWHFAAGRVVIKALHESSRSPGCSTADQILRTVIEYGDARERAKEAEILGGAVEARAAAANTVIGKFAEISRLIRR